MCWKLALQDGDRAGSAAEAALAGEDDAAVVEQRDALPLRLADGGEIHLQHRGDVPGEQLGGAVEGEELVLADGDPLAGGARRGGGDLARDVGGTRREVDDLL